MFKKFARFILRKEIADLRSQKLYYVNESFKMTDQYTQVVKNYNNEIDKCKNEIASLTEKLKNSEEDNTILREYYHLVDQEPSEEIQAKILLNLRCHDLEREIMSLKHQLSDTKKQLYNIKAVESIRNQVNYSIPPWWAYHA